MHFDEDFALALQLQEQFINEVNVKEVRIFRRLFLFYYSKSKKVCVLVFNNIRYCT
jgi:hypothetical protein